MWQSFLSWFERITDPFFTPFEDRKIVFKIKVETGNQEYTAICWYEVYGYWKFKGCLFYQSLGLIYEKQKHGKYHEKLDEGFLKLAEKVLIERFNTDGSDYHKLLRKKKRVVPVSDILMQLD